MNNPSEEMIFAVRNNDLKKVQDLIKSFGLSHSPTWLNGYFLLYEALEKGHIEIAKLLILNGSPVNGHGHYQKHSLLHLAIMTTQNREIVELLLNRGADISTKNRFGDTPLRYAIKNSSVDIIELLISQGYNFFEINSANESGWTPLHLAVEYNKENMVNLLLNKFASVNVTTNDGLTPLHIAARNGNFNITESLLRHGAYIHAVYNPNFSGVGRTPLYFACQSDNENVVMSLIRRETNIRADQGTHSELLYNAVYSYNPERIVEILLEHGVNVNAQDEYGKTVLRYAVERNQLPLVNQILKYFPDINNQGNMCSLKIAIKSNSNKNIVMSLLNYGFTVTPDDVNDDKLFHYAIKNGYLNIVESLLKYGTDSNMLNTFEGNSFRPLHSAAKSKQFEIAQLLINRGANVNAKDRSGLTPICYSIQNIDIKITNLLLSNGVSVNILDLLIFAIKKDLTQLVETLLQQSTDMKTFYKFGTTALQYANEDMDNNDDCAIKELVKLLLNKSTHGGLLDVNAESSQHEIALHIAAAKGKTKCVQILLKHNADVNLCSKHPVEFCDKHYRFTALHFAVLNSHSKVVKILLEFGADVDAQSKDGQTALHTAVYCNNNDQIVNDLIEWGSDINIQCNNLKTALEIASLNINPFIYINTIKKHAVKLNIAGLYLSKNNLDLIKSSNDNFENSCRNEVENMKNEKILNTDVTFYDILTKNPNTVAYYTRNENIRNIFNSDVYKTKFPIYANILNCHIRKAIQRNELLIQIEKCFHLCTNLPYACNDKIISYLSNKDLKILIDAFQNPQKN